MTDRPFDHEDYELLVPFVACSDHGGPFEPIPYTAGFEMGKFWQQCETMRSIGRPSMRCLIRRDNKAQADLIAMHFGMECLDEPIDDEFSEWLPIIFGYDIIDDTQDSAE
jgi:hypothetical protein